ncbi:hypothetical protein [Niastella sp. OAS944]|uniref:hypothetical protein n=1 Tax=Niastella sp. OAS944 TaxID=2664089 RepID=UPI003480CC8B|nr:hypothetical protein [Chitinophagaceae bacterium OAS944]
MESIILKTYKRDRDTELSSTVTHIDKEMTDNESFPDPPPVLDLIRKLLPVYIGAVADAKTREKVAISRKKDLKAQMIGYLNELAAYVTSKCNGDRTMLLSSGFAISGEKGEGHMPAIGQLDVTLGPPGIVTTQVKRVRGTRAYVHQYTTEPPTSETTWYSETTPQPDFTFSGLASGKTYWLRVAAMSKGGNMVYSPIKSCIIQ